MLAGVALFCVIAVNLIRMLVDEPIATSITVTRERALTFPTVTICSLSLLNATTVTQRGRDTIGDDFDATDKLAEVFDLAQVIPPDEQSCRDFTEQLASDVDFDGSWGELLEGTKYTAESLIEECEFAGAVCSHTDFQPVRTVGGVCYSFNLDGSHSVSGTGARQGLRLKLREDSNQYFSLGQDFGYRVVIHNPDEFPLAESDGISVALDSTAYIAMREVVSIDNTQFASGHDCVENDGPYSGRLTFEGYTSYSPSLCLLECFLTAVADTCSCVESEIYTPSQSPYDQMNTCRLADLCCEVREFSNFRAMCDCPPKCTTNGRTVTFSASTTDPGVHDVGVNVYYETFLVETRETTDSYTPYSLVADLAGIAGLFLGGFTLLTLAEIVMFVTGLCTDGCCVGYKRRRREERARKEGEMKTMSASNPV